MPQILKRNTFPRIDSGSNPGGSGWEHATMNKIRFVLDSSPSTIYEVRMVDFNGRKNISNGRKSGDR